MITFKANLYWADNANLYTSCVLNFGGNWTNDLNAGPFNLNANNAASNSNSNVGTHFNLSYTSKGANNIIYLFAYFTRENILLK